MIITDTSVTCGFGTKKWGDGRKKETLQHLLSSQGWNHIQVIVPHQNHTNHVRIIRHSAEDMSDKSVDGLVTSLPRVLLTVVTADCVPIVYYDKRAHVIGISHQGWRGTLGKLPEHMISAMVSCGAIPSRIHCIIGPSIRSCCYRIFGKRQQLFEAAFDTSVIRSAPDTQTYLDLPAANIQTLITSGVPRSHIQCVDECTSDHPQRYFSYARDGGGMGAMLNFIGYGI